MIRLEVRGLKQVLKKMSNTRSSIKNMNISDLGEAAKQKVLEGIRKNTGKRPYHTYKSDRPGELERSVKVSYPGKGRFMVSAYAPHAVVVEEGRGDIKGKRMVFRGFYNNPSAKRNDRYGKKTVRTGFVSRTKPKKYMFNTYLWLNRVTKRYFDAKLKRIVEGEGAKTNEKISVGIQNL